MASRYSLMILLACFEAIRNYDVGAVAPKGVGGNSPTAVSPSFSKISCGDPVGFVWRKLTHVCTMRHSHLKARCNWVHGSVSVVGGRYWLRRISRKSHGRYSNFVGICCRQTLLWLPWGVEAVGRLLLLGRRCQVGDAATKGVMFNEKSHRSYGTRTLPQPHSICLLQKGSEELRAIRNALGGWILLGDRNVSISVLFGNACNDAYRGVISWVPTSILMHIARESSAAALVYRVLSCCRSIRSQV